MKPVKSKSLVEKIESKIKEAMQKQGVFDLHAFRQLKTKPKTILQIEDDESVRLSVKRLLEAEGYQVRSAADASELGQCIDTSIDLILLDVGLPWVNGLELAKLIKDHDDLKYIPIVFLSGHGSEEDIRKGFAAGADDYIRKPFELNDIKKTIRVLLSLSDKK